MRSQDAPVFRRAMLFVLGSALAAAAVAGCVTAATPSPRTPGPTPTASPSPTPTPTPSPTPTFPGCPGAKPGVPAASISSGTWSIIQWQKLPAGALPGELPDCKPNSLKNSALWAFGWSRGYVIIQARYNDMGQPEVIVPFISSDGVDWHRGKRFSLAAINQARNGADDFYMVEGPAGLAIVATETPAVCGWWPPVMDAILTSKDGLQWSFLSFDPFGGWDEGAVNWLAGGGAGYLATGSGSDGISAAWTSKDLVSWHKVALDSAGFRGGLIQDAAVFAGGFVLTGYTWTVTGCQQDTSLKSPAAWWSREGSLWSPVGLPDQSAGTGTVTHISRITDRLLLITATTTSGGKTSDEYWLSHDGIGWSKVVPPNIDMLVTEGVRAFGVQCPSTSWLGCEKSKPQLMQLDANLAATSMTMEATPPRFDYPRAVGPAGFLWIDDDDNSIWLGTPKA